MFECPSCHDRDHTLVIVHRVTCRTQVARDESVDDYEVGDLEWSEIDEAECSCGWSGTVKEIQAEESEEPQEAL